MSKLNRDESGKPIAPRKDWPLTAHPNGQWVKKHKGIQYRFGSWDDWRQAETNYARRWSCILSGLPDPGNEGDEPESARGTFHTVCNLYLAARKEERDRGSIGDRHYAQMRQRVGWFLDALGWRNLSTDTVKPAQWRQLRLKMEDCWGPDARKICIGMLRSISKWGAENGHCAPWYFGGEMPLPSKGEIVADRRQKSREHGEKLFPREQVKPILDACGMPYEAMFLLALNAGFTAADCGELTLDALDLDGLWFDYDRVKTGVQRAGFLWPETVQAIRETLANRPNPNTDKWAKAIAAWKARKPKEGKEAIRKWALLEPRWDKLVFITRYGTPYVREYATVTEEGKDSAARVDGVGYEFSRILRRLDVKHPNGMGGMKFKRGRVSFATGRHTFYSAARRVDSDAARFIMGHADEGMGAWYDHLDDAKLDKLRNVCDVLQAYFLTQANEGTVFPRTLRLGGLDTTGSTARSA